MRVTPLPALAGTSAVEARSVAQGAMRGMTSRPLTPIDREVTAIECEHLARCEPLGHSHDASVGEVHSRPVLGQEALETRRVLFRVEPDSEHPGRDLRDDLRRPAGEMGRLTCPGGS